MEALDLLFWLILTEDFICAFIASLPKPATSLFTNWGTLTTDLLSLPIFGNPQTAHPRA
jgi:hypothetical protein